MIVGDGAKRAADAGFLEEQRRAPATIASAITAAAMSIFCSETTPPRILS